MRRIHVESTDIVSIGYDPNTYTLEIEFKGERIYQYFDVEQDVYERFMRADSYGEYFFASITKRYRYSRVEDGNEDTNVYSDTVAFVTGNNEKMRILKDACARFNISVEQLDLPVREIQSHNPEEIALDKAKDAYKLASRPVLVQDTYWNILALHGFPGAYMHDVAEWFRPEDFIHLLESKTDRTVIRTHTLVYYDGRRSKLFSKDFMGSVSTQPRGVKGPSIDKVVITQGQTHTNSELLDKVGQFNVPVEESVWFEFAKWYNLQRRLGKV